MQDSPRAGRRRDAMRRVLVAPLFLAIMCCVLVASAADSRPNILLILSDDHSAPHLGCYPDSNAITPNLDAFAEQGMRFNRAYTMAPQCAPSRVSIFTGRSPIAVKASRFPLPPPREHVFFTDVLRQHGYWVGLDGRHHHLSGRNRGEDHEVAGLAAAGLLYLEERFDHAEIHNTNTDPASLFRAVLGKLPVGKPFFLYFGFNFPHRGYRQQPAGVTLFDPAQLKLPPEFPDLPEVRADYADFLYTVHLMDRGFGVLMHELAQRGLAENTIVMFMGDNGESLLRGKGTLYERGTHVPLIVRWPGVVKPGSQSDALVSGEDISATLLGAVGLPVPPEMTGLSYLPALKGEPFTGREYVYAERGWHWGPITQTDGLDFSRAITSERYKFIFNALPDRAYIPVDMRGTDAMLALIRANAADQLSPLHHRLLFQHPRPVMELYDLQEDPHELNNLSGQAAMKEIETKLRIALSNWMVREGDFLPIPSLNYPSESWRMDGR